MNTYKKIYKRDIEFLFEIGSLRFIQRTWKRFLNLDVENLAEHHLRVVWISLYIAKYEKVKNTDKIMKMALLHDIAESRTGDADYISRQYVTRMEDVGIHDMLENTALKEEFLQLWEEYEKKESIEAKIVKDADNLDVDFEIKELESKGNRIVDGWKENRKFIAENKLYTETAKHIWSELQSANPHNWHYKGRNRFNSGDLKKK